MRVTVMGVGYVGLVTAACLAEIGHRVIAADRDNDVITLLSHGGCPLYEPGLETLLARHGGDRLTFSPDLGGAIQASDIVFITVGTPPTPEDTPDLSDIADVARTIGRALTTGHKIIVNKSTVPVGSGDWVSGIVEDGVRARAGGAAATFDVVSNPEFLREGSAIRDLVNPDRIVVGSASGEAIDTMRRLYLPIIEFVGGDRRTRRPTPVPFVATDLTTAELIKYASNAYLATRISFINEMATICELVGADIKALTRGIGLDRRIGESYLNAGIGFGGSCFPKDTAALAAVAAEYHYRPDVVLAAIAVNHQQRERAIRKLQHALKIIKGKTIGLLGLAFKPGTDDIRGAVALHLLEDLTKRGARLRAYDPKASKKVAVLYPDVVYASDPYALAQDADALVLVTEWEEFLTLDWAAVRDLMRTPVILDGRNVLSPVELRRLGFLYQGFGQ